VGFRLCHAAVDTAADSGLRPHRFTRGQAAWILEKFWAWTDCNGHPENILSRDELLDLEWSCGRIRRCPNRTDSDFGRERGANGMAEDGVGSLDF
jgi:hypothetical protein